MFQDPCHIIFILLAGDRAGTVDQDSARLYILPHHLKHLTLLSCECLYVLSGGLVFDVTFFADHSKSRTRKVCHYQLSLAYPFLTQFARIIFLEFDIVKSGPDQILPDQ